MDVILAAVGIFAAFAVSTPVEAQTPLQTAAFVMLEGEVDLDDLVEKDGHILAEKGDFHHKYGLEGAGKDCILEIESWGKDNPQDQHVFQRKASHQVYFSNVIIDEIQFTDQGPKPRISFSGDSNFNLHG